MMKRIALGLALMASVCALPVRADSGAAFISTRYNDVGDFGIGPGLKYTCEVGEQVDPGLQFDFRLSYVQYNSIDLDTIPLEAFGIYRMPADDFTPYVGIGGGYHWLEADRGKIDSDFGIQVLGGLDWSATELFDMFAEVTWLWLETDVDERFATTEGTDTSIDLNGFGVNVGLIYRF